MSKIAIVSFLGAILALQCTNVVAGSWHTAGSLRCGDCHIQHGSENNQPLPGGPFVYLLRKTTVNELCLSCHDGTDATAPDIVDPVQMYQATATGESSAGFFAMPGINNPNGHSLDLMVATPLQANAVTQVLTCASCHAVHGNGNYRNLLEDPMNNGGSISISLGTNLFEAAPPPDPPTVSGAVAAYERGNVAYVSNYSGWCVSCHDLLAANNQSTIPAHFSGHPSDVSLNSFSPAPHTDPTRWRLGDGQGFVGPNDPEGISRVPFLNPQGVDIATARTASESSQVFCLSCHKAHGSSHQKSILWPLFEGGPGFIAGCQQCHNK